MNDIVSMSADPEEILTAEAILGDLDDRFNELEAEIEELEQEE